MLKIRQVLVTQKCRGGHMCQGDTESKVWGKKVGRYRIPTHKETMLQGGV